MVGFGIKPKSSKRAVLRTGIFGEEAEEDEDLKRQQVPSSSSNGGIKLVNQSLKEYSVAALSVNNLRASDVDPSIYDFDAALDKRDAKITERKQKAISKKANPEVPRANYIGGLLSTAKQREKEREIAHERKLLKEREEEDKLYGDKPKFVTSAYKDKLAEDQKYVQEMEARELSQSDMKSTGMLGFYGGLLKTSVPASSFPPATSEAEGLPGAPVSGSHPPQRFSSQVRAVQSVNDGQGSPAGHTQTRLTSQDDPDTMTGTGDNIEVVVEGTREVEDASKDMDAMKRAERMVLVEAARARYFERVRLKQAGK